MKISKLFEIEFEVEGECLDIKKAEDRLISNINNSIPSVIIDDDPDGYDIIINSWSLSDK